ncbi:MAG: hypothetical protein JXR95_09510 [Deltaproteobacteria bacterium]|nr:hypothetical protein [Deltaproteobacteria bacterium]
MTAALNVNDFSIILSAFPSPPLVTKTHLAVQGICQRLKPRRVSGGGLDRCHAVRYSQTGSKGGNGNADPELKAVSMPQKHLPSK